MRWLRPWAAAVAAATWWTPPATTAFEFYAPFLPDHVAAHETITHIELRVYLNASEVASNTQIRITPRSATVDFHPPSVLFTKSSAVSQTITLRARSEDGKDTTIEFLATTLLVDEEYIQNDTLVASQTLSVLPPPLSFAIDDPLWNGVTLLNDSFETAAATTTNDSTAASPLWGQIRHGYPSSACGAADGDHALYFTALGDRFAMTKPLRLLGFDGKIHFRHVYGFKTTGQDYDATGDNRVSCELVDANEEVVLSYLPADHDATNASAWQVLHEIPRPPTAEAASFQPYSVALPPSAMHASARFRWQQKNHSSFPVDPVAGLPLAAIRSGANDETSVNGGLGVHERELWQYRNLFDQWALDDVRLEVRLNPPVFSLAEDEDALAPVATFPLFDGTNMSVAVGYADVLVASPVLNTWVEFDVGDGTHGYPSCDAAHAVKMNTAQSVRLATSGYVHAIACFDVYGDSTAIVSSFPTRSRRVLVQARPPTVVTTMDTTTNVDTWTVEVSCDGCAFMRYTTWTTPVFTAMEDEVSDAAIIARVSPSCSYGTPVDTTSGSVQLNTNNRLFVIACGASLLPSDVVSTTMLRVAPRAPTFDYTSTATTITNAFNVTISPPGASGLGIAYVVSTTEMPMCPTPDKVVLGEVMVTVKASDVIRAVACCAEVNCVDSVVATWGPIQVQAVAPVYSMACSDVEPLTMVVQVTAVTENAWIRYRVGTSFSTPLDCTENASTFYLASGDVIPVAATSDRVTVVSCLQGLTPSDPVEIEVPVEHCCAGIDSYKSPSCAHVLLFHDDFSSCLETTKWSKLTTQWGGEDVNGGVHAANTLCTTNESNTKQVLQLRAHGDLFSGTSPVGHKRSQADGSLVERTVRDRYLEWALDGVSPTPCNQFDRCAARRVGAAVQTVGVDENAGLLVVRLQPCEAFGTLTQIWWGDYTLKEAETQRAMPFLPLWKAGMYQAKTTPQVAYVGSSPSSLPETEFVEVVMQWNATLGRSNLYVDGQLVHKQVVDASVATGGLSIGVWFPNAVAGEPLFATCDVVVDQVHVFKAEVTGNRWCDFEAVQQENTVPCTSDHDCLAWVRSHCFMPIHEAVCRENTTLTDLPDHDEDDQDEKDHDPTRTSQGVCQFRMQPSRVEHGSTTEMTLRSAINTLEWPDKEP